MNRISIFVSMLVLTACTTVQAPTARPTELSPSPLFETAPPATEAPAEGTASSDDVVFVRPSGDMDEFVLGIDKIELWAVDRDGSNERLLTTYEPAPHAELFSRSPDGRYVVTSSPPGATLLDLATGEQTTLIETDPDQRVQNVSWAADGLLYYATYTPGEGGGQADLWRQQIDPLGEPQLLREAITVPRSEPAMEESPAYPSLVLPDDRIVMAAPLGGGFITWGLYDPTADRLLPFEEDRRRLIIHDARAAQVVYTVGDLSVFLGQITPDGELIESTQLTTPGQGWLYGNLRFLDDGRLVGVRFNSEQDSREVVIIEQDGSISTLDLPVEEGAMIQDARLGVNETLFVVVRGDEGTRVEWIVPLGSSLAPTRLGE